MPGKALKIIKGYLLVHIVVLGKKKKRCRHETWNNELGLFRRNIMRWNSIYPDKDIIS